MKIHEYSAAGIAALVKEKQISAVEVAKATIARIEELEPNIDAFITVTAQAAMAKAEEIDAKIAAGQPTGAMAGVPYAMKDNICTKGILTTCASRMLENFTPPYSATVYSRLQLADGLLMGKTNMDEFAMGSSTENSYFKTTKNPWDTSRVPGGSSGGSAAAVAAREVPVALGSDTGGSIRQPASYCGVLGMKPTYGAVSRNGVVPMASSLDQVGAFARTVDDMALIYSAICGRDIKDATSKDCDIKTYGEGIKGIKLGLPKQYFEDGIRADVREAVYKAVEDLKTLGAEVVEISLPSTEYALAAYYIIASAEASSNMARFDGLKYGYSNGWGGGINKLYETSRTEGFGDEVKRRIILGTYALDTGENSELYRRAKATQYKIAQEFKEAFNQCDAIITPLAPTTAFKIGEKQSDPAAMYAGDICTITLNLAGLPGISVPCGFDADNLPIGYQVIGPKFCEGRLLNIAKSY